MQGRTYKINKYYHMIFEIDLCVFSGIQNEAKRLTGLVSVSAIRSHLIAFSALMWYNHKG